MLEGGLFAELADLASLLLGCTRDAVGQGERAGIEIAAAELVDLLRHLGFSRIIWGLPGEV